MLTATDLRELAAARLADAKVLAAGGRHDGAVYIAGYAVECQLKAAVAETLLAAGLWPAEPQEFDRFKRLQVHSLPALLDLSGRGTAIASRRQEDAWKYVVANWTIDKRYAVVGTSNAGAAAAIIDAVDELTRCL